MGDAKRSKEALLAELHSLRRRVAELEAEHQIQKGSIAPFTTPHKQVEEALRESHDLLRAVIEGTPDMIFAKDVDGRHTLMNTSAARAIGRPVEDIMGKSNADLFPPEVARSFDLEDAEILSSGKTRSYENTMRIEGNLRTVLTTKYVYKNREGKTLGILGIARDITEHKQAEAERERMTTELEAKNIELERFAYTVSHDLKSPLVTVKGFLDLLQLDAARGDTERMQHDIEQIHAAADKMKHLLDDLLELSRIGRLMNPPEAVSLTSLAHEAVALVTGRIAERGVVVEIAPEMPVVHVDRFRLLEVLQNLIDNAVKYMGEQPAPHVEIGAEVHDEAVVCSVRDNGIGIDPRHHERIFGLFEQLDQKMEGTGIGLALVQRIVEVHGGRIWVESEGEGHGSTFCFMLPAQSPSEVRE